MSAPIHPDFPEDIWKHFYQLMQIPRGSGNTQAVQQHVVDLGKKLGYETLHDEAGNVMIRKPAFPGRESIPSVCLQCHLDMVCEHDPSLDIDMTKETIKPKLIENGEFGPKVMAQGTTLGADDGIGVAAALALLERKDVKHGPLEFLFTIDEVLFFYLFPYIVIY